MAKKKQGPLQVKAPLQGTKSPGVSLLGHLLHGVEEIGALPGQAVSYLATGRPAANFSGDIGSGDGGGGPKPSDSSAPAPSFESLAQQFGLSGSPLYQQMVAQSKLESDPAFKKLPTDQQNLLKQLLGAQQDQARQQMSQLAYQNFWNQSVAPYMQKVAGEAKQTMAQLPGLEAQFARGASPDIRAVLGANAARDVATSSEIGDLLQANVMAGPQLQSILAAIKQETAAQQAAAKAAAQGGGTSGAPTGF